MKKQKIAFIFLDEMHHLFHFIGIAISLSKTHEVSILTFPSKHPLLHQTLAQFEGSKVKVEELSTWAFRAFTDKLKNRRLPKKLFWMQKNKKYILRNFDALVFTDYIHHYLLKEKKDNPKPKFIKIPHGVAGRAYSYKRDLLDFDLNILFGPFYLQQLKEKQIHLQNTVVVGYPKLDLIDFTEKKSFFGNNKPTVLYNPHFTKALTSWYDIGFSVLEYFYQNKNYNLIFAPHINLFNKKGREKASIISEKYYKADNIHVDLGSINSVDMTYVKSADIYLGDVSSLVYEFIIEPRPCIFLNPKDFNFENDLNFRFWKCGEVINDVANLAPALEKAFKVFPDYKPVQQKITAENFHQQANSTPSERAAKAIEEFLSKP